MVYNTKSSVETTQVAKEFSKSLKAGDVVCLTGEMGVGKTVFTNGLCQGLGVTDYVTSPTFTIVNEYDGNAFRVFHFDMYRIEEEDELLEIGFDEYLSSGGVCVIEWPQNTKSYIPKHRYEVEITRNGENGRVISISKI